MEINRLHCSAEGGVGRVEQPVHLRRQPGGYIPVIRFRENVVAAGEAHFAVAFNLTIFFVYGIFDGDEAGPGHCVKQCVEIIARNSAQWIETALE